ncbi:PREDICTED: uncharacterized protein LOC18599299 isoform X4 [Theobroma cacao]|uniref:Uncharacterized protein LOC18599299 isoform X4 n=1 Tax=Theobroma cacao TaxID=3641 RepID=A0AB32WDS4_THECC|nr:PREDICTED: uncharacterized protein LOC18599299 isoform X4 [Theobroma cacao]
MFVCSSQTRCCPKERKLRGRKAAIALKGVKRRLLISQSLSKPPPMNTRRGKTVKLNATITRLKREMQEIREDQNRIREGRRPVKEKFDDVLSECDETELITRQSICTRLRLTLMFQILKARQNNDFAKAAQLTTSLRELIAQQENESLQQSDGPKSK